MTNKQTLQKTNILNINNQTFQRLTDIAKTYKANIAKTNQQTSKTSKQTFRRLTEQTLQRLTIKHFKN